MKQRLLDILEDLLLVFDGELADGQRCPSEWHPFVTKCVPDTLPNLKSFLLNAPVDKLLAQEGDLYCILVDTEPVLQWIQTRALDNLQELLREYLDDRQVYLALRLRHSRHPVSSSSQSSTPGL